MKYVFDTSAINRLYDDESSGAIVEGLKSSNSIVVSVLNIFEITQTTSDDRRNNLYKFLLLINNYPFIYDQPNYIVQKSINYYFNKINRWASLYNANGLISYNVLRDLKNLSEDTFTQNKEFVSEIEESFRNMHDGIREEVQTVMNNNNQPLSLSEFIDHAFSEKGYYTGFFNDVYKTIFPNSTSIKYKRIMEVSKSIPEVKCFFMPFMCSFYNRCIKKTHFGKSNPGNIDIWFGVYLPKIDYLITDDGGQYAMLKFISEYLGTKGKVLLYDTFRKRMLIG